VSGERPLEQARDARFVVAERWSEMANLPADHPESRREFLHRQMNEEVNGLEISVRNLADFPDAPWLLRMQIARQCADEARHVEAFRRAFERRGGRVGEYPVLNFQFRILMKIDSLVGRLAVQNRSFEAAGIDAISHEIRGPQVSGEGDLAALFDAQLADEVQHVRYANEWVKRLLADGGPRALMAVARATAAATRELQSVAGAALSYYPVEEGIRAEAGFDDAEIAFAKSLVPGEHR